MEIDNIKKLATAMMMNVEASADERSSSCDEVFYDATTSLHDDTSVRLSSSPRILLDEEEEEEKKSSETSEIQRLSSASLPDTSPENIPFAKQRDRSRTPLFFEHKSNSVGSVRGASASDEQDLPLQQELYKDCSFSRKCKDTTRTLGNTSHSDKVIQPHRAQDDEVNGATAPAESQSEPSCIKKGREKIPSLLHDSDQTSETRATLSASGRGEIQSNDITGENDRQQQQEVGSSRSLCSSHSAPRSDINQDSVGSIQFEDSSVHTDSHCQETEKENWQIISRYQKSTIVKHINLVRMVCGKIINQRYVQHVIVALIILNALQMGIGTFDFVYYDPSAKAAFEKVDLAFLVVFTIESILQLIFHGVNLFKDGWLTFDFLIVICSWCFASMQVFRTMRALRLVARIEMLRKLCQAIIEAAPRLTGIMCLFILIMYIYAVMITVLFGDMYDRGLTDMDYFSRLDVTYFTLFQMITLDWAKIVRQIMHTYPLAVFVFATYLSFTSFILFSLVIGVVCDAVSAVEHDAQLVEMLEKKEDVQERILRLQQRVDYLKKQQTSVLASVSTVLQELRKNELQSETKTAAPLGNTPGNSTMGFLGDTPPWSQLFQEDEKSEEESTKSGRAARN